MRAGHVNASHLTAWAPPATEHGIPSACRRVALCRTVGGLCLCPRARPGTERFQLCTAQRNNWAISCFTPRCSRVACSTCPFVAW